MPDDALQECFDGLALRLTPEGDALCIADCDGQPEDCCPSPCGRRFSVCLTRYEWSRETTISETWTHADVDDCTPIAGDSVITTTTSEDTATMEGGPHLIPWVGAEPYVCSAYGLFPVRQTTRFTPGVSLCSGVTPPATYTESVGCFELIRSCPVAGAGSGPWPDFPTFTAPTALGSRVNGPDGSFSQSFPIVLLCSGVPTVSGTRVFNETIERNWQSGIGSNVYEGVATQSETVDAAQTFCVGPVIRRYVGTRSTVTTWRLTIRYTLTVLEDCQGEVFPSPACAIAQACAGPIEYIAGDPCQGEGSAPRVLFYAAAVDGCDTVEVGGVCYRVSRDGPRVFEALPSDIVSNLAITDQRRTCCSCQSGCPSTAIVPRPCWNNARRIDGLLVTSAQRPDLVSPPFISGDCCCRDDDLITISGFEQTDTITGVLRKWTFRDAPSYSFRRNQPFEIQPFFLRISYPNGEAPPSSFNPGSFSNSVPMACEWTTLGTGSGTFFQFATPQEGLPATAQGGGLPCPDGSDPPSGWRIKLWNISAICQSFFFSAEFENPDNGAIFTTRYRISITPNPAATGRCTGGCPPPGPLSPFPTNPGIDFPQPFPAGDLRNFIGGGG